MKKKGFTLIELLAVIVVLAVIVLIAIPVMLNIIDKSKLGSLKDSAYGVLESANLYYAQYRPNNTIRFDLEGNNVTSNDTNKLLKYKGSVENGVVILDKRGDITVCITDGTNSAYKNYTEKEITVVEKNKCYIPDNRTVVYLEGTGATRSELTNQELTDEIALLKDEIASLKARNQELEDTKADQSDLDTTNSNLEAVSTVANNANTLATNAATKTELTNALKRHDASNDIIVTSFQSSWSSLTNSQAPVTTYYSIGGPIAFAVYSKFQSGVDSNNKPRMYGTAYLSSYSSNQKPVFCVIVSNNWTCSYIQI